MLKTSVWKHHDYLIFYVFGNFIQRCGIELIFIPQPYNSGQLPQIILVEGILAYGAWQLRVQRARR